MNVSTYEKKEASYTKEKQLEDYKSFMTWYQECKESDTPYHVIDKLRNVKSNKVIVPNIFRTYELFPIKSSQENLIIFKSMYIERHQGKNAFLFF